jgi:hypothetical protein
MPQMAKRELAGETACPTKASSHSRWRARLGNAALIRRDGPQEQLFRDRN